MKMKKAAAQAAEHMLKKLGDIDLTKVAGISVSLMMKPPAHLKKKMKEHHEDGPRAEEEHDVSPESKPDSKPEKGKKGNR